MSHVVIIALLCVILLMSVASLLAWGMLIRRVRELQELIEREPDLPLRTSDDSGMMPKVLS